MAQGLEDILDGLQDASEGETVSVGDLLDAFADRSLGAILTVFGALASVPVIGGIPGMSILIGSLITLAILQSLFSGKGGLWAPDMVRSLEISEEKFSNGLETGRSVAKWVDRLLKPRLEFLAQKWAVAGCALLMALTFFPMAVVPWGAQVSAAAVMVFGLSLLGKDGLFALAGYVLAAITGWLIWSFAM